ncbi:MAG TPA: tetratricopeptide repeat protein [Alphaproteobacteria bacterium]|nr:tetratricopeptide repeat protein [Alphaproteobacteria bacterium]
MSDIFREIEEDLQRDRLQKLWKKYGVVVIAAAVVLVIGTGGWEAWSAYRRHENEAMGARYADALRLASDGKTAAAEASFAKIAADASSGYGVLARLQQAALLIKEGKTADAIALYDKLAADGDADRPYRDLAILLSVYNDMATGNPKTLSDRLAPLTEAGNPWRNSALELQALLAQRTGDTARAEQLLAQISDDGTAPPDIRARAAELLAALKK